MLSTNVILLAIVMIGLIYLYYNKNFREGYRGKIGYALAPLDQEWGSPAYYSGKMCWVYTTLNGEPGDGSVVLGGIQNCRCAGTTSPRSGVADWIWQNMTFNGNGPIFAPSTKADAESVAKARWPGVPRCPAWKTPPSSATATYSGTLPRYNPATMRDIPTGFCTDGRIGWVAVNDGDDMALPCPCNKAGAYANKCWSSAFWAGPRDTPWTAVSGMAWPPTYGSKHPTLPCTCPDLPTCSATFTCAAHTIPNGNTTCPTTTGCTQKYCCTPTCSSANCGSNGYEGDLTSTSPCPTGGCPSCCKPEPTCAKF